MHSLPELPPLLCPFLDPRSRSVETTTSTCFSLSPCIFPLQWPVKSALVTKSLASHNWMLPEELYNTFTSWFNIPMATLLRYVPN
jgi:hypothetical protein